MSSNHTFGRICRIELLTNRNQSFYRLEIFPLRVVVKDVLHLRSEDLTSSRSLMDANASDSHRPWGVPDAQLHVNVIGPHILFQHTVLNHHKQRVKDLLGQFLPRLLKLPYQRFQIVPTRVEHILLNLHLGRNILLTLTLKLVYQILIPYLKYLFGPQIHQPALFFLWFVFHFSFKLFG